MKLTKSLVKTFEREQKQYGTETALYNVFWLIAAGILRNAGVTGIKTRMSHLRA